MDAVAEAQRLHSKVNQEMQEIINRSNSEIQGSLDKALGILKELKKQQDRKHDLERKITDAKHKFENQICESSKLVDCRRIWERCIDIPFVGRQCILEEPGYGSCRRAVKNVEHACKIKRELESNLLSLKQQLDSVVLSRISALIKDFKTEMNKAHNAATTFLDNENKLSKSFIDLITKIALPDANPIKGVLESWVDDNKLAMKAYFQLNAKSIHNTMKGEDMIEPLEHWSKCYAPTFLGIPSEVTTGHCAATNAIQSIREILDAVENIAIGPDPLLRSLKRLKKQIEKVLFMVVKDELLNYGKTVTGIDMKDLAQVLSQDPTNRVVNMAFMQAPANKMLILIPNMSDRVHAEMNLKNGHFDPSRYSVIKNAITMTKLSLLDQDGLNTLAGKVVYSGDTLKNNNAILRLSRNIDGNHPWLSEAPPYARSNDQHVGGLKYGYSEGWPFWRDIELRNEVFRKLFDGPLSSGIDTPLDIGFDEVLPASYDYRVTSECSYPNYPVPDPCPPGFMDKILNFIRN